MFRPCNGSYTAYRIINYCGPPPLPVAAFCPLSARFLPAFGIKRIIIRVGMDREPALEVVAANPGFQTVSNRPIFTLFRYRRNLRRWPFHRVGLGLGDGDDDVNWWLR